MKYRSEVFRNDYRINDVGFLNWLQMYGDDGWVCFHFELEMCATPDDPPSTRAWFRK